MDFFNSTRCRITQWVSICILPVLLIGCAETLPPGTTGGSDSGFDQALYDATDNAEKKLRGGRLYDEWWTVKGFSSPPPGRNPVWEARAQIPGTDTYYNESSTNGAEWRCKECHGWDYKGQQGAYSLANNPNKYTGVNGLNNANGDFTPELIFGVISNGLVELNGQEGLSHKFSGNGMLSNEDIYQLTRFIYEDARVNSANPNAGNASAGKIIFESQDDPSRTQCTACHYPNNTVGASDMPEIVEIAQTNPEEFFHKVRYGQPGSFMPAGLSIQEAQDLRAYVAQGSFNETPSSNFSQATYNALGRDSVVNGGLLYDKWWIVSSNTTEPTSEHGLWPASNTTITGSDTWRCKECHGWDYRGRDGAYANGRHASGIAGIISTASASMTMLTADNVYSFLKSNTDHGFANSFFTDSEYYDLTKFIMTMRTEASAQQASFNFINDTTKLALGADNDNGQLLYEGDASCAACHGADGKLIDFGEEEFVHDIALDNPWEFIHKIRFGQPGSSPPMGDLYAQGATVREMSAAVDILGYSQTSLAPNNKRAGLLYDKWWTTNGVSATEPSTRNPIWEGIPDATTDTTLVSDSGTWRCKECHGWDYLGVNGAYGDTTSKHYSGISGFIPFSLNKTKALLESAIADGVCDAPCNAAGHSFSQYLSAEDISLLADFILNMASTAEYNAALASTDTSNGQLVYQSDTPGHCEGCHGADGNSIGNVNVAAIANDNPQEFIHKARYGHPGSTMVPPNQGFLGLTLADAGDVLAYSKTLGSTDPGPDPQPNPSYENASLVRGGLLYDKWWKVMQVNDATVQEPTVLNPFYQAGQDLGNLPPLAAGNESTSWRCKTCHAWNYKGVGYYTGNSSDTGADNLLYKIDLRRQTYAGNDAGLQQHLFDWIKTGYGATTHIFGGDPTPSNPNPMTDQDIWDVVKFLLEGGLTNTDLYILSSGIVIGTNNTNGEGLYNGSVSDSVNCASCHGVDGDTPPTEAQGGTGDPLDIFAIAAANDNPWEVVHKTRFGQPGTPMPAFEGIPNLTLEDAYDVLGYMQQRYNERQSIQQISKGSR